jgi:ferredoxin
VAAEKYAGKILILATESCAYPGADAVGQGHQSYPANTFILRVKAPVLFPEQFYLDCFHKGIAGIIVMSCGVECPYEGALTLVEQVVDGQKVQRARVNPALCLGCGACVAVCPENAINVQGWTLKQYEAMVDMIVSDQYLQGA